MLRRYMNTLQDIFLFIKFCPHIIANIDVSNSIDATVDAKEGRLAHRVHPALL